MVASIILTMQFSLMKAIKSTHRNPVNRMLHCIGAPIYIFGILMIIFQTLGFNKFNFLTGIILWSVAMCLFLIGHKIEGNLRAMTLIVFLRFVNFRLTKFRM